MVAVSDYSLKLVKKVARNPEFLSYLARLARGCGQVEEMLQGLPNTREAEQQDHAAHIACNGL